MKPVKHVAVGGILGGITLFFSTPIAIGAFLGSLIPDFDHIIFFWQIVKFNPREMFSLKRFSAVYEMLYPQAAEKHWLELGFIHSIEACLIILWAAILFHSPLLFGLLGGVILHCLLDYWDMFRRRMKLRLRCWSIIQFFIRKRRGEKTYFEVWPRSN